MSISDHSNDPFQPKDPFKPDSGNRQRSINYGRDRERTCPNCGFTMEEVRPGEWECPDCGENATERDFR